MDALTFMWVSFAILCIIGSIIVVTVEDAVKHKKELKRLERETRKLENEIKFLNLMIELHGGKYNNANNK